MNYNFASHVWATICPRRTGCCFPNSTGLLFVTGFAVNISFDGNAATAFGTMGAFELVFVIGVLVCGIVGEDAVL